jgi:hypothetical protein
MLVQPQRWLQRAASQMACPKARRWAQRVVRSSGRRRDRIIAFAGISSHAAMLAEIYREYVVYRRKVDLFIALATGRIIAFEAKDSGAPCNASYVWCAGRGSGICPQEKIRWPAAFTGEVQRSLVRPPFTAVRQARPVSDISRIRSQIPKQR